MNENLQIIDNSDEMENEISISLKDLPLKETPEEKEERKHKRTIRAFVAFLIVDIIIFGFIIAQICLLALK